MSAAERIDSGRSGEAGRDGTLAVVRHHILADPDLQNRLAAIDDERQFAIALGRVAADLGRDAKPEALRPEPRRAGVDDHPPNMRIWPGRGWLPEAVVATTAGPAVDWVHFGGARLTEPFFADSLRRARRRPFNRLVRYRTPLSLLANNAPELRAPTGLVFHMSRCGSTLVAQMLAADPTSVVVSEAPPLDAVVRFIRSRPAMLLADRLALLRAMVGALGRQRTDDGHYVVKLDSWHALSLPLFRLAFPDTPWIFLYRDPVEVIVSHLRQRGSQMVPGMGGGREDIVGAPGMSPERHVAQILAEICRAAAAHHDFCGMLVRYDSLPDAVTRQIVPHFGIAADASVLAAMAHVAERDSKTPVLAFTPYSESKRLNASAAVRTAATHLDATMRQLDALRPRGKPSPLTSATEKEQG